MNYTFELEQEQARLLLNLLGDLPNKSSAELFINILKQAQQQEFELNKSST